GVELREALQRLHTGAHDKRQGRQAYAGAARALLQTLAQLFELGDVRLIELRDVRQVHPARGESRTGDALHAAEGLHLDGTKLREVGHHHPRPGAAETGTRTPAAHHFFDEALQVFRADPALVATAANAAEVDPELARKFAHRRARMRARKSGLIDRYGRARHGSARGRGGL